MNLKLTNKFQIFFQAVITTCDNYVRFVVGTDNGLFQSGPYLFILDYIQEERGHKAAPTYENTQSSYTFIPVTALSYSDSLCHKHENTLDGMPIHLKALGQTHTHKHNQTQTHSQGQFIIYNLIYILSPLARRHVIYGLALLIKSWQQPTRNQHRAIWMTHIKKTAASVNTVK